MKRLIPMLLLLSACGTPGQDVSPAEGDFAFIEVKLKG